VAGRTVAGSSEDDQRARLAEARSPDGLDAGEVMVAGLRSHTLAHIVGGRTVG
jgi:hypothetical protein